MGGCYSSKSVDFRAPAPIPIDNVANYTFAIEEEMNKLRMKQSEGWSCETPQNATDGTVNGVCDEQTLRDLLHMGFHEYKIKQAFKYTQCNHNNLLPIIEWIESHPMSEEETENYRVRSICIQLEEMNIKCTRLAAMHAIDEVIKMEQECAVDITHKAVQYIAQYLQNGQLRYDNLENHIKEEYMLRDQILIATIESMHLQRRQSFEWKDKKPSLMAELRSMGFLQAIINQALSQKSVKNKKSAIKWIINHPLSEKEELNAKIEEIVNSGFCARDAQLSLDKFDHNLSHSLLWLNQNKADQLNHYLYHFKTQKVLQIDNDVHCILNDVNFHNECQKWSIWKDGKIKNFHSNQILAVKCIHSNIQNNQGSDDDANETNPFLLNRTYSISAIDNEDDDNPFDVFMDEDVNDDEDNEIQYEICIVSEAIVEQNNDPHIVYLTNWNIDGEERVIKMTIHEEKQSCFYFVCRNNKFHLDTKYHEDDMQQRWCVLSKIELTELNPRELAKELDDPDAECVICFDREPNVILNPCGHSNFCTLCLNEYQPVQCPICRTHIKSVLHSK